MKVYPFRKADRLLKRADFLALSRKAPRVQTDLFLLVYLPGRSERTRLGITVTRKVGKAVHRNAVKRQVREYFRHLRPHLSGCWDMNVIAKRQAAGCSPMVQRQSLVQLFTLLMERTRH